MRKAPQKTSVATPRETPPPRPRLRRVASEEDELLPVKGGPSGAASNLPPMIQRSQEAFRRNLPRLLQEKERLRQWVAYHGEDCLGFAASRIELYQRCLGQGLARDDFVVRCIVPEIPAIADATPLVDV
jgi:hypothetical protein